jgi:hypothetical protein
VVLLNNCLYGTKTYPQSLEVSLLGEKLYSGVGMVAVVTIFDNQGKAAIFFLTSNQVCRQFSKALLRRMLMSTLLMETSSLAKR